MKTQKLKHLFLMSALLLSVNAFAKSSMTDSDKGNGGSSSEAQLASSQVLIEDVALKIKHFFTKNEAKLSSIFPEFKVKQLINKISEANLEAVNEDILIDKNNVERTCLNFPKKAKIQCSSSALEKIANNPQALFVLILHEYLGLIGVEETSPKNVQAIDGYSISKKLATYVTKINQYDLSFQPTNLLDVITHPENFGKKREKDDSDYFGGSFLIYGVDLGLLKAGYHSPACAIRIHNDNSLIKIVYHELDASFREEVPSKQYELTLFKKHMNKNYTQLNMKKGNIRVKMKIENGMITLTHSLYFKGIIPMAKGTCLVDLNKQNQEVPDEDEPNP